MVNIKINNQTEIVMTYTSSILVKCTIREGKEGGCSYSSNFKDTQSPIFKKQKRGTTSDRTRASYSAFYVATTSLMITGTITPLPSLMSDLKPSGEQISTTIFVL